MITRLQAAWKCRSSLFTWMRLWRPRDFFGLGGPLNGVMYVGLVILDPLSSALMLWFFVFLGGGIFIAISLEPREYPRWRNYWVLVCWVGIACPALPLPILLLEDEMHWFHWGLLWSGVLTPVWLLGIGVELRAQRRERVKAAAKKNLQEAP